MSTKEWAICWVFLVPSDASLELLDRGMEIGVRLTAPLGRVGRVHDRRVIAAEQLADARVRCVGQPAAEVHGELSRHGDLLRTPAGAEILRPHGEPLAHGP